MLSIGALQTIQHNITKDYILCYTQRYTGPVHIKGMAIETQVELQVTKGMCDEQLILL